MGVCVGISCNRVGSFTAQEGIEMRYRVIIRAPTGGLEIATNQTWGEAMHKKIRHEKFVDRGFWYDPHFRRALRIVIEPIKRR